VKHHIGIDNDDEAHENLSRLTRLRKIVPFVHDDDSSTRSGRHWLAFHLLAASHNIGKQQ